MSGNFFAYVSRMRLIRRWSLMRNSSPENIQEHSHRTALLAHALAVIARRVFGKEVNAERAAFLALLHDAGEVMTGDLPTPVKYFDANIREAYRGIEAAAARRLLSFLPPEFRPDYEPAFFPREEDAGCWRLVRAADKLCAWLKCVEELRGGNREFAPAEAVIRKQLADLDMEELRYFLERFAPGFSLALDELEAGF
ncbi:MAG: 5'-deoxynucleotidase, partial [Planctomycetota bacterium]|nr:5'-deoxynucleotidase [Planctomycetota bacterium]